MANGKILYAVKDGNYFLRFIGDIRVNLCAAIDGFLSRIFRSLHLKSIIVDLTETQAIDSTSLGLLAKTAIKSERHLRRKVSIISTNPDITTVLLSMGFDGVFEIHDQIKSLDVTLAVDSSSLPGQALEHSEADTVQMCDWVLEAHRYLMQMNNKNQETFKVLVEALEIEQSKLRHKRKDSPVLAQISGVVSQDRSCPRIDPSFAKHNLVMQS